MSYDPKEYVRQRTRATLAYNRSDQARRDDADAYRYAQRRDVMDYDQFNARQSRNIRGRSILAREAQQRNARLSSDHSLQRTAANRQNAIRLRNIKLRREASLRRAAYVSAARDFGATEAEITRELYNPTYKLRFWGPDHI